MADDFSTNQHSASDVASLAAYADDCSQSYYRHPDLSFNDGNIAILAADCYFLVHRGLLSRHSISLAVLIQAMTDQHQSRLLEGRSVLSLDDDPNDLHYFFLALYDGISDLRYDKEDFARASAVLRMSTKYEVSHLRRDIHRGMTQAWPQSLAQWEIRETNAINSDGVYDPRSILPHPINVINLARITDNPTFLPSAFYDLSRCPPSEIAAGIQSPTSGTVRLADEDLMLLLKGKEHASRFFSTFVVNELEGREPSPSCIYHKEPDPGKKRNCQAAFEAITFEILRDANGGNCHRSSDPLFAIVEAELMQTRDSPMAANPLPSRFRACEYCRMDFESVVDAAREDFWRNLPVWFGVTDLTSWA